MATSPFNPTVAVSDQWTGTLSDTTNSLRIFEDKTGGVTVLNGLVTVCWQFTAADPNNVPGLGLQQTPASNTDLRVNINGGIITMTVKMGGSNTVFASDIDTIDLIIPARVMGAIAANASGHYRLDFNYCACCTCP